MEEFLFWPPSKIFHAKFKLIVLVYDDPDSLESIDNDDISPFVNALENENKERVISEAAELWFHSLVALSMKNLSSDDILNELDKLPEKTSLELDVRKTRYLDNDIIEILDDFSLKAKNRKIDIYLVSERGDVKNPESFADFFKLKLEPKS